MTHTLSFPERNTQYVHVNLRLPAASGYVELYMPSWTPGSYLIRDYAAHVERFRASAPDGRSLETGKVAKNRWRVESPGAGEVVVDYDVWAGEIGVHVSWVESGYALINGSSVFLYGQETRELPQRVVMRLPPDWPLVHTSLKRSQDGTYLYASDFDELVDSPIVAGQAPAHRFDVAGQPYAFVNVGDSRFWDAESTARDLAAVVEAVQSFWGVNPFDREYLFLNLLVEGRGGLEHDHSTVMLASHWQTRYRKDYVRWLALATHEFFHAWNVRRMRPEALASYDYDREVYTRELWLAEGLSSYYDNLLLFRAELITATEFFELLATEFHRVETAPGRKIRSLELASFDAWIKHYQPDANSANSTVSYYRKGSVLGFVADTELRRRTDNEKSLDDVMREMYRRYANDSYPPGAFEEIIEAMAGSGVRAWVEELLTGTGDPDIDAALDWYGLQLNRTPGRKVAEDGTETAPAGLGIQWAPDDALLVVQSVINGGSGAIAGVLPGDELIAIDGLRVRKGQIDDRLMRLSPGESIELTLARHDELLTLPLVVREAIPVEYVISLKDRIREREKRRLEAWLKKSLTFTN